MENNPSTSQISLEAARDAGRLHGERAYYAMLSPEMFEEFLRSEAIVWREAGFSNHCVEVAETAARAAYRGNAGSSP